MNALDKSYWGEPSLRYVEMQKLRICLDMIHFNTNVYSLVQSQRATAVVVTEWPLLLQNVNEVKQSNPALAASFQCVTWPDRIVS